MSADLSALIAKLERTKEAGREIHGAIYVALHGWSLASIAPDADGQNACEIYACGGRITNHFALPNRGAICPYFLVPDVKWLIDPAAARSLTREVMKTLGYPGWTVQSDFRHDPHGDWCKVTITVPSREWQGCSLEPCAQARAEVIAALRARAALNGDTDNG